MPNPIVVAPAKSKLVPIAVAAGIAIAGIGGYLATRKPATTQVPDAFAGSGARKTLTPSEGIEVQKYLGSASSFANIGNFDSAEENYIKALEIDCTDPEGKRGLAALNPEKAKEIVAGCDVN